MGVERFAFMRGVAGVASLLVLLVSEAGAADQTDELIRAYEARIDAQQQQLDQLRAELDELKKRVDQKDATVAEAPAAPADPATVVQRKNRAGSVQLSGRLHRVLMNVDDGLSNTGLFMDSDQGPTMLRVDSSKPVSESLTLGGTIEFGVQNNRSFRVSQDNPNPGTDILVRIGEVVADHKRYGKVSFGRGFAAAWAAAEVDLSGTVPATLLPVGMLAPALKFADRSTGQLSDIRVNQYFVDAERLLLTDRLRYDSPSFGGGMRLAGSIAPDSRWDLALRYFPELEDWALRSAITYQSKPFFDVDDRVDIFFSARHKDTGLSLTGTWANSKLLSGRDSNAWVVKGGWLADLNDFGPTGFSVDYYLAEDVRLPGDEGKSIGLMVLQKWQELGLDIYGGYRVYDVARPDIRLHDLNAVVVGAIYSF